MESNKRQKTKKCLENAMVKLLSDQPFDQITTVKLTQEAEISRSSFYTHYKDKFDMIDHYQDRIFHTLDYIFDKHDGHLEATITEIFEFLKREPLLATLLSENGTQEIQQFIRKRLHILWENGWQGRYSHELFQDKEKKYAAIYLSNAFLGVYQLWIAQGKKESPQAMARFLMKMLKFSGIEA